MTVSHTTALNLLGKYVSFYVLTPQSKYFYHGVVQSVIYQMDGKHQLCINFEDFYYLSDLDDIKILGDIILTA